MIDCHLGEARHQALVGLLVCDSHLQRLNAYLRDVEQEADQLDARPSMEIRWDQSSATLASQQSPVRLGALAAADRRRGTPIVSDWSHDDYLAYDETLSAYDTLHRWAQRVRRERMLARPIEQRPYRMPGATGVGPSCETQCVHESCGDLTWWWSGPARLDVASERKLLTDHLEWIVRQPWVRSFYRQVAKLREQLKATNGTSDPKPLPGRCPLPAAQGMCNGYLWDVKPLHTVGEWQGAGPSAVQCASCLERWEGGPQLALLAIEIDMQRTARAEDDEPMEPVA